MGFLESYKERGRLAQWRKELEAQPRPHGIAELARRYLSMGDSASAARTLDFGDGLFPTSDELRRVRSMLLTDEAEERLREAKESVRTRPSPGAYLLLADCYHAVGRIEQCAATLRESTERFGEDPATLEKLGEIRLLRYRDSMAVTDAVGATQLLLRSIAAEPGRVRARAHLAELYFLVGGWRLAREQVDAILGLEPGEERALALREALASRSEDLALDLESQLTAVEDNRAFCGRLPWEVASDPATAERSPLAQPAEEIRRLLEWSGLERVVFVVGEEPAIGVGSANEALGDASARLSPVFDRTARGMELGMPAGLILECESGALIVEFKRGATLAMTTAATTRLERVVVQARDALERLVRS